MAQTVNYQPQQGQFKTSVAEQTPVDWSLLVNMQVVSGRLTPRAGWKVLKRTLTYSSVADPSSPDGFAYQAATTRSATYASEYPLGAFLFSGPQGQDWILSLSNPGAGQVFYRIVTTAGEIVSLGGVAGSALLPFVYYGMGARSLPPDLVLRTYVFVRWYDTVFFTNGGLLWKWEPLKCMQPRVVEAFHSPQSGGSGKYITGYVSGATILCVHQDSLLLSGFLPDSQMAVDSAIDLNGDGIVSDADATKVGGYAIGPGNLSVQTTPYTVWASDRLLPNCFSVLNVNEIGSQMPVTALASHGDVLAVFTQTEMWTVTGAVADPDSNSQQPLSRTIGCMGPRSVCQTDGNALVWLADDGVYAWTGANWPEKVSAPVVDLFRGGVQAFWRWAFQTDSPDPQVVGSAALRVQTMVADLCSAVWVAKDGYVAIATSSSLNLEPNDLVLCWSPKENQWWVMTGEPATPNWLLNNPGLANAYWSVLAPTRRSWVVGCHTLMTSTNEPGMLFCQGCKTNSYLWSTLPFPDICLAALSGTTDDADNGAGSVVDGRFASIAVSAPIFLGNSDERVHRRLFLRMMAWRVNNFVVGFGGAADANPLRLYTIPEQGHTDVLDIVETTSTATEQTLDPWPDSYLDKLYFWQVNGFSDVAKGKWQGTPLQAPSTAIKRWLPRQPVDKRVDLSSRVSQWVRVALVKIVDGQSDPSLELLSAAIEIEPGYGTRK